MSLIIVRGLFLTPDLILDNCKIPFHIQGLGFKYPNKLLSLESSVKYLPCVNKYIEIIVFTFRHTYIFNQLLNDCLFPNLIFITLSTSS